MMNKMYINIMVILLFSAASLVSQTSIKWQETFDAVNVPAGWQVIDADKSGSGLVLVPSATTPGGTGILPQTGRSFWTSNAQNANLAGVIDEWLISPRISVIYAGDSLYFWAGAVNEGFDDSLQVKVSTTDSNPASFKHQLGKLKVDGPAGTWHRYGFDLSAFDSSDIYFAINYYIRDGGPGGEHSDFVWIDHPVISGDPAAINNPPSMVYLKEPSNQGFVDINLTSFDFMWTASRDLDAEDLYYTLSIVNVFPQMQFTSISDTSFSLDWKELLLENVSYRWTIQVTDGKSVVASTDTFKFKIADPAAIASSPDGIPNNTELYQNYPNPFNPMTNIEFRIPNTEFVTLKIYNILGKEVATLASNTLNPGNHTYQFDGKDLASGVYYYQIVAGEYREVKKMILLR